MSDVVPRFVTVYRLADQVWAQGPWPNRRAAAMSGAVEKAHDFALQVEVVQLVDREVEWGHVPLGLDADGNGPVPDEEAVRFVCMECGCPGIAANRTVGEEVRDGDRR